MSCSSARVERLRTGRRLVLDADVLGGAPVALRRAAVWRAMCRLAGRETIGFEHAENALRVLSGAVGGFDAPAVRVERESAALVLTGRPPGIRGRWQPPANLFEYSLSIPGEVALPEAGWILSAEPADRAGEFDSSAILAQKRRCRRSRRCLRWRSGCP